MKTLNVQATAVFNKLIDGLTPESSHKRIDNTGGSFMPVVVEYLRPMDDGGAVYSVSHYYEQNGDLMADPDMTFWKTTHGFVLPMTYRQDGLGIDQEGVFLGEDGKLYARTRQQAGMASFANTWMKNIKDQQRI